MARTSVPYSVPMLVCVCVSGKEYSGNHLRNLSAHDDTSCRQNRENTQSSFARRCPVPFSEQYQVHPFSTHPPGGEGGVGGASHVRSHARRPTAMSPFPKTPTGHRVVASCLCYHCNKNGPSRRRAARAERLLGQVSGSSRHSVKENSVLHGTETAVTERINAGVPAGLCRCCLLCRKFCPVSECCSHSCSLALSLWLKIRKTLHFRKRNDSLNIHAGVESVCRAGQKYIDDDDSSSWCLFPRWHFLPVGAVEGK